MGLGGAKVEEMIAIFYYRIREREALGSLVMMGGRWGLSETKEAAAAVVVAAAMEEGIEGGGGLNGVW